MWHAEIMFSPCETIGISLHLWYIQSLMYHRFHQPLLGDFGDNYCLGLLLLCWQIVQMHIVLFQHAGLGMVLIWIIGIITSICDIILHVDPPAGRVGVASHL